MHLEGGEGVPVMHGPMQANVVPHPLQGPLQTDGAKKKQYHGQERHVGKIREEGDFHDDDDEPPSRSRHKKRTNERRTKRSRRNSSGGSSSSSQSGRSSHGRFPKKGASVCDYTGISMRTADADDIGTNEYLFELDCLQTMHGIGGRQVSMENDSNAQGDTLKAAKFKDVPDQPEFCIDAGTTGNVALFINHSCEPNLFVQCVNEHHDLSRPRVWLFATDTIPPLQVRPF
ncbi:hypothetical protein L7F22_020443 [Adiantum nelumboides]|nr:hypothetical protein [Adiantum nelumboides]